MDAITLEVMRNRFFAITEEMGAALIRTAYSTNIKDRRDCSCALFNINGDTIAQAEHIPVHSGVLPWGVKGALKHVDKDALKPGDAIMHNDPFIGGTHLPDIIIFSPIFYNGREGTGLSYSGCNRDFPRRNLLPSGKGEKRGNNRFGNLWNVPI